MVRSLRSALGPKGYANPMSPGHRSTQRSRVAPTHPNVSTDGARSARRRARRQRGVSHRKMGIIGSAGTWAFSSRQIEFVPPCAQHQTWGHGPIGGDLGPAEWGTSAVGCGTENVTIPTPRPPSPAPSPIEQRGTSTRLRLRRKARAMTISRPRMPVPRTGGESSSRSGRQSAVREQVPAGQGRTDGEPGTNGAVLVDRI